MFPQFLLTSQGLCKNYSFLNEQCSLKQISSTAALPGCAPNEPQSSFAVYQETRGSPASSLIIPLLTPKPPVVIFWQNFSTFGITINNTYKLLSHCLVIASPALVQIKESFVVDFSRSRLNAKVSWTFFQV